MAPVPSVTYWDPSGSPVNTFDPLIAPFGPAVVLEPQSPLLPDTVYRLVLDPTNLLDRKKQIDRVLAGRD